MIRSRSIVYYYLPTNVPTSSLFSLRWNWDDGICSGVVVVERLERSLQFLFSRVERRSSSCLICFWSILIISCRNWHIITEKLYMQLCIHSYAILCTLPLQDDDTRTRIAELMTMRKVQFIWNYIWINYNIKINGTIGSKNKYCHYYIVSKTTIFRKYM